jgi:hypothetical protein
LKLKTHYSENLPSANFKERSFSRTIEEELPDDIGKDELIKRADRQQKVCETLVKLDIERTLDEIGKESK